MWRAPSIGLLEGFVREAGFVCPEEGGSILTPDGSIFVIFAIFIALVPTLNAIVVKPIMHVLAERDRLTAGAATDARAMLGSVEMRLAAYEEGIRDARAEGYQLLEARRS